MKMIRRYVGLCALLTTCVLMGACGVRGGGAQSSGATRGAAETGAAAPVEVDNCGRTLRLARQPQRIVSLWPSITEMLIDLGAGDRLVGQAFTDQSPPLAKYADAYAKVPVLGTNAISRETLLRSRPDLIVADGEYHFNGKELPTISALAKLNISVYVVSSFCNGHVTTGRVSDVTTDLKALGTLLDAAPAATRLSASVDSALSTAQARVGAAKPVPLVLCQVFDKALYADSGGLYSDVVTRAGGKNLYDGALPPNQYYAQISTEDLAKKNPGVIVYAYNSETEKASTLAYLRRSLPTVEAVRRGKLIAVPSVDFINLRAVDGVTTLAAALHPHG